MDKPFKDQHNKADPISKTSDPRRELFRQFSEISAKGFEHRDVVYAAANLIANAIRQNCKTQKKAEAAFDEMATLTKRLLLDEHYYPNGKRRDVFPFDQHIGVPHVDLRTGRKHH